MGGKKRDFAAKNCHKLPKVAIATWPGPSMRAINYQPSTINQVPSSAENEKKRKKMHSDFPHLQLLTTDYKKIVSPDGGNPFLTANSI